MSGCSVFFLIKGTPGFIGKCIGSGLFVSLCLTNVILSKKIFDGKYNNYVLILLVAMVFACVGDVTIELNFIVGAIVFGLGHIFFLIAFFKLVPFNKRDVLCSLIIAVPSILIMLFYDKFDYRGMGPVLVGYAVIVSTMLGKAVSMLFSSLNRTLKITIFVGALMFFLSDLSLLFYQFASGGIVARAFCLFLYYPSCIVLAITPIISIYEKKKLEKAV